MQMSKEEFSKIIEKSSKEWALSFMSIMQNNSKFPVFSEMNFNLMLSIMATSIYNLICTLEKKAPKGRIDFSLLMNTLGNAILEQGKTFNEKAH